MWTHAQSNNRTPMECHRTHHHTTCLHDCAYFAAADAPPPQMLPRIAVHYHAHAHKSSNMVKNGRNRAHPFDCAVSKFSLRYHRRYAPLCTTVAQPAAYWYYCTALLLCQLVLLLSSCDVQGSVNGSVGAACNFSCRARASDFAGIAKLQPVVVRTC
jgi:hypothetical protein